jgi:archaellum component FlaC
MASDLINRLREVGAWAYSQPDDYITEGDLMNKAADTIEAQAAEIERLKECLKKANANHEHFEREWYLRGDEVERQAAEIEELYKKWRDCEAENKRFAEANLHQAVEIAELKDTIERQAALLKMAKEAIKRFEGDHWYLENAGEALAAIEEYELATS